MFAIAFDLDVDEALKSHPKGVSQAYSDISKTLRRFAFERVQGSVFMTKNDDMANLFSAMLALRAMPWFRRPFATSAPSASSNGPTSRP